MDRELRGHNKNQDRTKLEIYDELKSLCNTNFLKERKEGRKEEKMDRQIGKRRLSDYLFFF